MTLAFAYVRASTIEEVRHEYAETRIREDARIA